MKLYRFPQLGKIENLKLCEEPQPQPGPGQVVVRVRATALNFRDLLIAWNQYPAGALKPNVIPLSDGAGEIVAVGAGVDRVKVGDRVAGNFLQRWIGGPLRADYLGSDLGGCRDGLLTEYALLPQEGVVKIPAYLSFEEAGSLACAGLTAWSGLTIGTALEPGHTVLVQGTGGVSIFALQFAKAFGARVIATTSSAAKAERLKALGADAVVDYRQNPEWERKVLELTGGQGVDRVIEVAGPGTMNQSLACLGVSGRLALVGFVGGFEGQFNPLAMLGRGHSIDAISVGHRDHFDAMLKAMERHQIHPVIDRVFAFDEAAQAYQHLQARAHVGKVVIRC